MRPNGLFFLETSFASAFAASAAIIEMTYFKRPHLVILMLSATVLSLGGTGLTALVVAAPFLLARQKMPFIGPFVIATTGALVLAYMLGVHLPLVSRLDELHNENSSGSGRLLIPASQFLVLMFDPSYLLMGSGPGSTGLELGSAWPILKLTSEYGLLTMVSFLILYGVGIIGNFNLPLKVALSVVYHFTGGYLLNPIMVELVVILCFIPFPVRRASLREGP
jgi:hypothetical protein